MLSDPTYFQAIYHSLDKVKALFQAQADLGAANESIASNNLTLQDDLYRLRQETQDAFDEAKRLEIRWKDVEKEQRELYQRFNPQFLLLRLRHATTAQDDLTEAVASDFVQNASSSETQPAAGKAVDDFVKEFKAARKQYHKRVIWSERWAADRVIWHDD